MTQSLMWLVRREPALALFLLLALVLMLAALVVSVAYRPQSGCLGGGGRDRKDATVRRPHQYPCGGDGSLNMRACMRVHTRVADDDHHVEELITGYVSLL